MARLGVRLETGPPFERQDLLELASLAEERGYDTIWLPEGSGSDAMTQLTAFATSTQHIKLGTGILPIFSRTPTLTAMSAGGLDALSNGRFILGLGVGHQASVENSHGVTFRRPMTRLRETVEIVRRMLRGESVTYEGRVFRLKDAALGFSPVRPDVPIYIAALGPQMIELAGEIADGVLLTWASPGYLPQAAEHLRKGAEKAGRNPEDIDLACYVRTAVVDDMEEVRPALQRQIARYFRMPYYRNYFEGRGFKREANAVSQALAIGDDDGVSAAISDDMIRELAIVGSAEHCRQEVEARRALGLDQPVIAPFAVLDAMKSFRDTIEAFSG
jgi:5,10-methylenetetrahydromethanopterin reductase